MKEPPSYWSVKMHPRPCLAHTITEKNQSPHHIGTEASHLLIPQSFYPHTVYSLCCQMRFPCVYFTYLLPLAMAYDLNFYQFYKLYLKGKQPPNEA